MKITVHKSGADGMIKIADRVLSQYSMSNEIGCIPIHIKGQGTISALSKLQSRNYFDVCTVRSLAELHGVVIPSEIEEFFRVMHCVEWNKMTEETRDYIMSILVKFFEEPIRQSQL